MKKKMYVVLFAVLLALAAGATFAVSAASGDATQPAAADTTTAVVADTAAASGACSGECHGKWSGRDDSSKSAEKAVRMQAASDAKAKYDALTADQKAALKAIDQQQADLQKQKIDLMVNDGLIDAATAQKMKDAIDARMANDTGMGGGRWGGHCRGDKDSDGAAAATTAVTPEATTAPAE